MGHRFVIRAVLAVTLVLGFTPIAGASEISSADPITVTKSDAGSCFKGAVLAPDCALATLFAEDWQLAGAAQNAQIMTAGGVATNASCGYYLEDIIVSRYDRDRFVSVFDPMSHGVAIRKSSIEVPDGFYALEITAGPYDAYGYIALRYTIGDPQVAGIAAPLYVLTASPVPRAGPGTMPVPADPEDRWVAPVVSSGTGSVVVLDTTTVSSKMDVAPADGWMDATAGHATFIEGILEAAYQGPVELVDATDSNGLFTEAAVANAIAEHKLTTEDVVNLSAGTYACHVGDVTIYPLLLADAVVHLDGVDVHLVAAAGNDATTLPFYPAAWGVMPTPEYRNRCPVGSPRDAATKLCMVDRSATVTSVGSVTESKEMVTYANPAAKDRSAFSNHGSWVEAWAVGEDLVSTYPSGAYDYCVPNGHGQCLAPGGIPLAPDETPAANLGDHVEWEGTSFSAPQVAAWIAGGHPAP